jgi:hypothetical protein
MASTLLLDPVAWDLTLDVNNNIAVVAEPYALAQDAASAMKVFQGEMWWDTTVGVPYLQQIFGQAPPIPLVKQLLINAAMSASTDIASAQVFFAALNPATRQLTGQVQIISVTSALSAANFSVSAQGVG